MMRVGLLPIAVFLALGVAALAAWALIRVINEKHDRGRVSARHAIVLMVCCTALWLGLCYFFRILASLGHSAYPLRDARPQCLVSFLALIVAPLTLLVWLATRRSG
jgi:formate-dependent nitrite reductase membrane component NrfD